jgi:hypothetical protein
MEYMRHRLSVKIHEITLVVSRENGDIDIKDYYVVLPRGEDNNFPPHPMILDYTMTHDRFGRTRLHPVGSSRTHEAVIRILMVL